MVGGQDATEDFMAIHSESAQAMLIDYHIGHVDHPIASIVKPITTHADKHFLSEFSWKKALLVSRKTISHNTRLFRFKLENEKQSFGLPVGNHIFVRTKDSEGKFVLRAYTPISPPDLKGYFELLIKVYLPCAKFPNGGKMSCLVEAFSTGYSQIEVKGPLGSFEYLGNGLCLWKTREFQVDDFIMIAAGSGITH
jgi:nitrate reductase (NAD(P)H)